MSRLVIIGAGGHAQVIADVVLSRRAIGDEIELIGFVDDDLNLTGRQLLDRPVLGSLSQLAQIPHDRVVVGIGDNATRARIFAQCVARGEKLATLIHPRAVIGREVEIGDGTVVFAGAVINTQSHIDPNVIINTGATVDHHARIGAHVHVAPGVHLGGTIALGAGAFLGVGVNVIPNCTIGNWTTVGAGATVTHDLPERVVAVGTPARIIKTISETD